METEEQVQIVERWNGRWKRRFTRERSMQVIPKLLVSLDHPMIQMGYAVGGSEEFRMTAAGAFHADGDIIAYSTTIGSDKRLKENINPLKYGLEELLKIKPVSYD